MADGDLPILPIEDMQARHTGLTPGLSQSLHEAARVCLSRHHLSPSTFLIDDNRVQLSASARWESPTLRERRAWADDDRTTENGAEACALAALELTRSLVAVGRCRRGTGADYFVSPSEVVVDDIEDAMRFEISGTDRGAREEIVRRLRGKIGQVKRGQDTRPGIAAVVGFKRLEIRIQDVV